VSFRLFGGILRHRYFSRNLFSFYFNGLRIDPLDFLKQLSATYQDREN
tara:strand:- start:329 stop:472 length:144 start_codon:yes stop_codon:yes gene_type:complete